MSDWLVRFPATVWGLLLFIAMLVAALAGHALHARLLRGGGEGPFNDTQQGYIVSAAVTLLAFMIGFTFSIALDRFEGRRQLVGQDARAIQKLYLQAQILGEPHRSKLSGLLVQYTDNRVDLAQQRPEQWARTLAQDNRLLREIWTALIPAFNSIRGIEFSSVLVESANHVFEMDAARRAARNASIPSEVFAVLFAYAIVTALVFGYVLRGFRSRGAGSILLFLCVMSIVLLIDLNQPVSGSIRESQEPMKKLSQWLHANPPSTFSSDGDDAKPIIGG